jgi:hypothetical protein
MASVPGMSIFAAQQRACVLSWQRLADAVAGADALRWPLAKWNQWLRWKKAAPSGWGALVSPMPKRSTWRIAQFDTLRLRLIKIGAGGVEMKTIIRVHLPTSCPAQNILRLALQRIPRLVM